MGAERMGGDENERLGALRMGAGCIEREGGLEKPEGLRSGADPLPTALGERWGARDVVPEG